ncbi:hypothetical protein [Paenibacillus aceris]|uniref:Cytochrome c-type biogenesis protein CcmH/NrfF n=1 Tax=Paenibacillus aceris TaxID=869555 RepID=A0ABS4IAB2_9BACL|nr:hypothetical protein [Paenibacillus aceris]MBP1967877.1 cytochrome c-type biogenesis protein CcmH/NrfF [Paenibacillus aceris]NHW37536.1 hypothetical protein [Paenibacillus aceris]
MIFWIIVVVIVVIGLLIVTSAKKKKAVESMQVKTHKECSYCNEEIEIDAAVCKYCRGVVVSSS